MISPEEEIEEQELAELNPLNLGLRRFPSGPIKIDPPPPPPPAVGNCRLVDLVTVVEVEAEG